MKHKYLVMWHPTLVWGAPIPSLHRCKEDVYKATGLTAQKIRKMGWKWLTVWIDVPDGKDGVVDNTGGLKVGPPATMPDDEAVDDE